MCYKTAVKHDRIKLQKRFKAEFDFPFEEVPTAPVQAQTKPLMPVILDENPELIIQGKWGLIPYFAKSDPDAFLKKTATYNAKIETVEKLVSYKNYVDNRCLIITSAFYEWKHVIIAGKVKPLPYELSAPGGEPFALAGLYSMLNGIPTYTVLMTEANTLMAEIHNSKKRMPVVLCPEEEEIWLKRDTLQPYHSRMEVELVATPLFDTSLLNAEPNLFD
jgi:putative SOS response-associated peptidase YedK